MSWKHFTRDRHDGRIKLICILSDVERMKCHAEELRQLVTEGAEALNAKSKKERFDEQSWDSLKSIPLYEVLREYKDVLPDDIPAELPQDKGFQHEVGLVPGTKYTVTRLWWSGIGNFAVDLVPSTWDEKLVFAFTLPGTGYILARPTLHQDIEYLKIEVNPDAETAWPGVCPLSSQPTARGSGKLGKEHTHPRQPQARSTSAYESRSKEPKIDDSTIHWRSE
ncbi:unnamed protein product [Phytophthora fragariaefolia]|uniref:Unnamed protein product n=1 Tax=Phytophthora fragariaefolia TaxID=1490495 RepID=A0A9W6TMC3_9STRA|nr:unnamed protein product [Phytophthora fragariaefolia]